NLFKTETPDGNYSYNPGGSGLKFNDIGLVLGTCAAKYLNPASKPVIDCGKIKSEL
ncbi:MAG: hypothetical protein FJ088_02010, partial [Deltaproteobacteria bacterium]|nr:hypothetical protein [Deltaproteobacteria bacterium]